MTTRTILSIDGGGVRGLLSAGVLAHIEQLLRSRNSLAEGGIAHNFDLIVGTSSGALIGLGLAVGNSAQAMVGVYQRHAKSIFSASWLGKWINPLVGNNGATYKPDGLERVLRDILADYTLGHLGSTAIESQRPDRNAPLLMCTAYDTQQATPRFFKSWKPAHQNLPAWQVARASSAAPTYFPPMTMTINTDDPSDPSPPATLIDGGLFANNPAMSAWAEAKKLWPEDDILILSIGSGERQEKYSANDKQFCNMFNLIKPTFNAMFDGQSDAVEYQLGKLYADSGNYLRLQTELAQASDSLDNVEAGNLRALEAEAMRLVASQTGAIDAFIQGAWR
ncbi:patatin-like phospholipase family protein [Rhodoferax aquaticus]|uniref:patatin-like phospholipase family protein n=1 Tax=Rhodoferax aquaticus TaxID=2527691 RepID=UPI00143CEFC1|nr:patatin-like phospholipase family protein [Rhodoferax aquaticus]